MPDILRRPLPETPADWRALLAEHRGSGLSARAFCATRGIPYHRFIYWRRKLGTRSGRGASSLAASRTGYWLFSWTEAGAAQVGIIQSLITTCRLQGVDPYTYLVAVLQRVSSHPASRVEELTPRRWRELFADHPMKSDLDTLGQ